MAEGLFDPRLLGLRAAGARWLRDRRPADARQFADGARVIVEQLDSLGAEVERLRAAIQRVRDWNPVDGRNEFGNGYREALRDVRDLLPALDGEPEAGDRDAS